MAAACRLIDPEPTDHQPETRTNQTRAPATMPEAPPPCTPAGLGPDSNLPGDMNIQSQINPLASADAGGTAGHDAAACVSAHGKCDGASVCDARDARVPSPTTHPARQVVAPHRCHMTQRDGPWDPHRGDPHRGSTQGTHTEGTHTEERAPQRTHHRRGGPHRGPTQDTHRHC